MIIRKQVSNDNFYYMYLLAWNGFLKLSNKEIEILNELLIENERLVPENKNLLFDTTIRKRIQKKLNISVYNLNNYISNLKKKSIIKEREDGLYLNPKIIPKKKDEVSLTFSFIFNGKR